MRHRAACFVLSALLCLLVACGPRPARTLTLTFLDVGQGDCTIIEAPGGRVIVVDAGGRPGTDERTAPEPGGRTVLPYLRSRGISTIDLVVATHADEDHVQGLLAVCARLRVRQAMEPCLPAGGAMARLRALWRRRGVPIVPARRGASIDLGDGVTLEILHPGAVPLVSPRSPSNDNATVLRVRYGEASALLTADLESFGEDALMAAGLDLHAELLKIGHHGSRWSTSTRFLSAVRPRVAVISCGRENRFGHPHKEVLERLVAAGVPYLRTDRDGAIIARSDGGPWQVAPWRYDNGRATSRVARP